MPNVFCFSGCLVCISIAFCNVAVVLELSKIRSQNRILIRRISRSLIVNRTGNSRHQQTPEEVAFAKLMAYISVIFCLCWGPQIVSMPKVVCFSLFMCYLSMYVMKHWRMNFTYTCDNEKNKPRWIFSILL